MSTRKVKYFSVNDLKKVEKDADYIFLLGERANGKSYAVKSHLLQQAFNNITENKCYKQIGYIRRFDLDCKDSMCEPYFSDMPIQEITKGMYDSISVYRKKIYFGNVNNETGRVDRSVCIGNCYALSSAEHYKSLMYPHITNIIYEEVVSERNQYLYSEPFKLQQLISTIFRDRKGKVYLIGNTLSRMCPYYNEWGLEDVEKMNQGETIIYKYDNTIIKVHRTKSRDYNSGMFFGLASKNITKGEYTTEQQPHLKGKINDYNIMYEVVLKYNNFRYMMRFLRHKTDNFYVWYVEPKTTPIKEKTRVIALEYNPDVLWTNGFLPLTWSEEQAFKMLLVHKKVVFSDNLTGTEFNNIIHNFK